MKIKDIFLINILYIFIFILIFYLVFYLRKYKLEKEKFLEKNNIEKEKNKNIYFPSKLEILEKIKNLDFFKNLNNNDLIVRKVSSIQEYKELINNNLLNFNKSEKNILVDLVNKIDKKLDNFKLLKNIKWKFIKINKNIENGFPHTHDDIIFLPNSFFKNPNEETLLHEKIHIFQRKNNLITNNFFKLFNFKLLNTNYYFYKLDNNTLLNDINLIKISKELKKIENNKRSNPDIKNMYSYDNLFFYSKYNNTKDLNNVNLVYYCIIDTKKDLELLKKLNKEHNTIIKNGKDDNYRYEEFYQTTKKHKINSRENFNHTELHAYQTQDDVERHIEFDDHEIRNQFETIDHELLKNDKDFYIKEFKNKKIDKKFLEENLMYYENNIIKYKKNKKIINELKNNNIQNEHPNEIFAVLLTKYILNSNYKFLKLLNNNLSEKNIDKIILNYFN